MAVCVAERFGCMVGVDASIEGEKRLGNAFHFTIGSAIGKWHIQYEVLAKLLLAHTLAVNEANVREREKTANDIFVLKQKEKAKPKSKPKFK